MWSGHKITEIEYELRIQQIRRGIRPVALPAIEIFDCKRYSDSKESLSTGSEENQVKARSSIHLWKNQSMKIGKL